MPAENEKHDPDDMLCIVPPGVVAMSVCCPRDWSRDAVERVANAKNPTGISSRWTISADECFSDGAENGCACDQTPADRRHWLLTC